MDGPDAYQWCQYKDEIIDLYELYGLPEVQRIMLETHFFDATKRMYERKFKQWGITKYNKPGRSGHRAQDVAGLGTWSIAASPSPASSERRNLKFSRSRHSRQNKCGDRVSRSSLSQSPASLMGEDHIPSHPVSPPGPVSSPLPKLPARQTEQHDSLRLAQGSSSKFTMFYPSSSAESKHFFELWDARLNTPRPRSMHNNAGAPVDAKISFPQQMSTDTKTCRLDSLLKNLHYFLHRPKSTATISPAPSRSVEKISEMWSELSYGIYLLKVESPTRAWPALHNASEIAEEHLRSSHAFEFDFLLNLFATLSPVNTQSGASRGARKIMLQYFHYLAAMSLPPTHPIYVICHELQQDDHEPQVSEKALVYMADTYSIMQLSVYPRRQIHMETAEERQYQIERQLVRLLRRDDQLDNAFARAKRAFERYQDALLLNDYVSVGGTIDDIRPGTSDTSSISLYRARKAATDLAHIHIERQNVQDYMRALQLCFFQLTGTLEDLPHQRESEFLLSKQGRSRIIRDRASVYAMEDLSKINSILNQHTLASRWLEVALDLCNEDCLLSMTARQHIADKLECMRNGVRVAV